VVASEQREITREGNYHAGMIDTNVTYQSLYYKACNNNAEAIRMTGLALETVRKRQGVSQVQAAKLLGLSQPMLSHMETGKRSVSLEVAQRAAKLFGGDATVLPLDAERRHSDETLASELGALGYPGYAHLSGRLRNPAEFLLDALDRSDLNARTTEGLPWIVLKYPHLDWAWLLREVKLRNRQNRLGFVASLANRIALQNGPVAVSNVLEPVLRKLEDARLAKEDTLCQESRLPSRKQHVRALRSRLAAHWNLDTRLSEMDLAHYCPNLGCRS
jgi:transcriptional regulator with XRE-family HTH domain